MSDTCALPPDNEPSGATLAATLSSACFCITLDQQRLQRSLAAELGSGEPGEWEDSGWTQAFAHRPVFISLGDGQRMAEVIAAIERVIALPAWQELALSDAPAIARHSQGAQGVFYGYDFHVNGEGIGLIEVNTNAGGALMNTVLARAQQKCCSTIEGMQPSASDADRFEHEIVEMFRSEWRAMRDDRPLGCVAIVDSTPRSQYMYPEFVLFQRLLSRHGIRAVIADPGELSFAGGVLRYGEVVIDLVYNRLTDFYLEAPESAALRNAYVHDAAVITPHPRGHALYADKRRMIALTDPATLQRLGVPEATQQVLLQGIPRTELVRPEHAADLWARRRSLFFKPFSGYGGRAAYRGDKLTKRVWEEILAGGYIAQALVSPGSRPTGAGSPDMKFDLRYYVYQGRVQWTAARMYQGQTTNFRTPGGGFSPVYTVSEATEASSKSNPQESAPGARASAPVNHASYVFLLDDAGGIHPLPHALYVALARGEGTSPSLAGLTLRIADWYVRVPCGEPKEIVSEWYGWARFDDQGKFDPTATPPEGSGGSSHRTDNIDPSAFPTPEERIRMLTLLDENGG